MSRKQSDELVAMALRNYVKVMVNDPDGFSQEEAKTLDRALRSCPAISDIDRVWVQWSYVSEQRGWTTEEELKIKNGRYAYPNES